MNSSKNQITAIVAETPLDIHLNMSDAEAAAILDDIKDGGGNEAAENGKAGTVDEPGKDTGPWITFIDGEDKKSLYQELDKLRMAVSRGMRTKDFTRDYRNKTVCITSLTMDDIQGGILLPVSSKCFHINCRFQKEKELDGSEWFCGTVDLTFKREEDLQEQLPVLKSLKEKTTVLWLKNFVPPKKQRSRVSETRPVQVKSMFDKDPQGPVEEVQEIKTEPEEHMDCDDAKEHENSLLEDEQSIYEQDVDDIPYKANLTLYTSTITGNVTEDKLGELFPLANRIILTRQPFVHVYIIFNKEELLQKNLSDLLVQSPCLPPFQITRLSHASESFRQINGPHRRNRNIKKKKVPTATLR